MNELGTCVHHGLLNNQWDDLQVGIFHEIEDLINTYGDITGMYNSVDI